MAIVLRIILFYGLSLVDFNVLDSNRFRPARATVDQVATCGIPQDPIPNRPIPEWFRTARAVGSSGAVAMVAEDWICAFRTARAFVERSDDLPNSLRDWYQLI